MTRAYLINLCLLPATRLSVHRARGAGAKADGVDVGVERRG